jgi:hypothetical protein
MQVESRPKAYGFPLGFCREGFVKNPLCGMEKERPGMGSGYVEGDDSASMLYSYSIMKMRTSQLCVDSIVWTRSLR